MFGGERNRKREDTVSRSHAHRARILQMDAGMILLADYFLATTGTVPLQSSDWFVGGGCTTHICGKRKQFVRYTEYGKSEEREISDFAGR